jgi:GT2 family glycosyltransferase
MITTYECRGKGVFFTEKVLKSVLSQTYRPLECVISDHSMDDDIENMVNSIDPRDVRVIYVRHMEDYGIPASNFNNCLKYASGKYLQHISMDNFFHCEKCIENVVEFMDDHAESPWFAVSQLQVSQNNINKFILPSWPEKMSLVKNVLGGPDSYIYRDSLKHITFDKTFIYCADNEWVYRMFIEVGKPPVYYNEAQFSCVHHPDQQQNICSLDIHLNDFENLWLKYGTLEPNYKN